MASKFFFKRTEGSTKQGLDSSAEIIDDTQDASPTNPSKRLDGIGTLVTDAKSKSVRLEENSKSPQINLT